MENFRSFIVDDFFPPAVPTGLKLKAIFQGILTTICMALSSTSVAAVLAFVTALFASKRVSPIQKSPKFVRGFATFLRNIPALVWAFILFSSLGIGTGVGFVALCISSYAFMVRAFAETIDDISQDNLESLQAAGASFIQVVFHGILPSCLRGFISWFLYCIEVNLRSSTVVGMVGGGGIGLVLLSYLKGFKYNMSFTIILAIAVMVLLVDALTNYLRKELDLE
ncbi:PhnE/PtxC family ABC transporter permease [Hallerella succinigenes]|uniref:PhnE/PtxC family ABC transporter permease n=2 Tax=Hallerella TaxID=2815788 RepID=UPI0023EFFF25|nr:ABC transporter permease subunit [Hallerella succinigenes]